MAEALRGLEPEKIPENAPESASPSADALSTCPTERRKRYRRLAERARRQRAAAIQLKCLDCCAWQAREVRRCAIRDCALWSFRPYQEKSR